MTPEEFRQAGHGVVDWIADFRAGLDTLPVMARTAPGEVASAFPATPPETPQPLDAIFATLDRTVVPGLTHFGHPRFFGFFPSGSNLSSVLGDFLSTGLGAARPDLAVGAGADRGRGGHDRLGAADGRPVARLARRDPGHRVDGHAGGAGLRARAGVRASG